MELSDIMALVKAGYTKDEIAQMDVPKPSDPNPEPVPVPVENPVPEAKPTEQTAQAVEPVSVAVPAPAPAQEQPTMADIMQSIAKLTSAVQANAIAQSVIPAGLQNPAKAEDMIAEIIRPTFKERG